MKSRKLTPTFAGVNYERLEGYKSLQWPVHQDGTDEPLLYTKEFPFPDGKANVPSAGLRSAERRGERGLRSACQQRPLAGALRAGEHELPRTRHQGASRPDIFLEVSPELARERGLQTGQFVRIENSYGQLRLPRARDERVQGKEMYLPMISTAEAGEQTDQHARGSRHAHAGLQRAVGEDDRAG